MDFVIETHFCVRINTDKSYSVNNNIYFKYISKWCAF